MHETFDHTADLGLRIQAADLNALFAEAAEALVEVLVEDPTTVQAATKCEIQIAGSDREYLLFDWLKFVLYQFEVEHFLSRRFEVDVSANRLTAVVWGEAIDRSRHELGHEVKAITYHGLKVEQTTDGWPGPRTRFTDLSNKWTPAAGAFRAAIVPACASMA
jgi:SHS2 domain-containing protein